MEFEITETEKYKNLVRNQSSVIELAKVESTQAIARQLEEQNKLLKNIRDILPQLTDKDVSWEE